ncbi:MAG: hypothetical protein K1X79_08605 [Oligoflexia bacterium]|nr:hypothetical protein [Oligoflexia bacterium]
MAVPVIIFVLCALLFEALLALFPTFNADNLGPGMPGLEFARAWRPLINTSSNSFLYWRPDFLHSLIATNLPWLGQNSELIVASALGTIGAALLFYIVGDPKERPLRAALQSTCAALVWTLTLRTLFGFDHVIIGCMTWLPWLVLGVVWSLRRGSLNTSSFIVILFLTWRLASSANQLAFGLAILAWVLALACCDRHLWPTANSRAGILMLISLALSLLPLAQAPYVNTQGFPVDSHLVSHDGLPAMVRALVGESPRIPFINRLWLKESLKDCSVIFFALSAIAFYLCHRRRAVSKLMWYALGLALIILFDTLPIEHVAQIAPLAALGRIIPGYFLYPCAYLGLATLPLLLLLASPQRALLSTICLGALALVPPTSGGYMQLALGKLVDLASQRALAEYSLLNASEQQTLQPVIYSPSYTILNAIGLWPAFEQDRIKHTDFMPVRAEEVSITASTTDPRYSTSAMLDRDEATRWATGRASQHGDEWIYIKFAKPIQLSALELDVAGYFTDFPRGVRLSALTPCPEANLSPEARGNVHELVHYWPWEGALEISKFGFPYFQPQHQVRIFLPKVETIECLLVEQTGFAPQHDWSVAELRLGLVQ